MKVLEIKISLDGDRWCALVGENLQEGFAGFGNSPAGAIRNLICDNSEKLGEICRTQLRNGGR